MVGYSVGDIFAIWFGVFLLTLLVFWIVGTVLLTFLKDVDPEDIPIQRIAFVISLVVTALIYAFT